MLQWACANGCPWDDTTTSWTITAQAPALLLSIRGVPADLLYVYGGVSTRVTATLITMQHTAKPRKMTVNSTHLGPYIFRSQTLGSFASALQSQAFLSPCITPS